MACVGCWCTSSTFICVQTGKFVVILACSKKKNEAHRTRQRTFQTHLKQHLEVATESLVPRVQLHYQYLPFARTPNLVRAARVCECVCCLMHVRIWVCVCAFVCVCVCECVCECEYVRVRARVYAWRGVGMGVCECTYAV